LISQIYFVLAELAIFVHTYIKLSVIVAVLFVLLKVLNVVSWPWIWVLSPIWIVLLLWVLLTIGYPFVNFHR